MTGKDLYEIPALAINTCYIPLQERYEPLEEQLTRWRAYAHGWYRWASSQITDTQAQAQAINDRMELLAAQPLSKGSIAEMHALGGLAQKAYDAVHNKRISKLN